MPRWRRFVHFLTLSCRDVSRLVSEGQDRRLTMAEAVAVRLHSIYCSACRRFRQQLAVLRRTARHICAESAGAVLPPDLRARIVVTLRDQM
jgi:predicted anti-sigma-YlaC factor YlaD